MATVNNISTLNRNRDNWSKFQRLTFEKKTWNQRKYSDNE